MLNGDGWMSWIASVRRGPWTHQFGIQSSACNISAQFDCSCATNLLHFRDQFVGWPHPLRDVGADAHRRRSGDVQLERHSPVAPVTREQLGQGFERRAYLRRVREMN